jgi:hypothetical protein
MKFVKSETRSSKAEDSRFVQNIMSLYQTSWRYFPIMFVWRLVTDWRVWGSKSGGCDILHTHLYRPRDPPSLV